MDDNPENDTGLDVRRSARRGRRSSQLGLLRHVCRRSGRRHRGRGRFPGRGGRIRSVNARFTGCRPAVALAANVLAAKSTEQTHSGNRKNSTHWGFLPFQSEARDWRSIRSSQNSRIIRVFHRLGAIGIFTHFRPPIHTTAGRQLARIIKLYRAYHNSRSLSVVLSLDVFQKLSHSARQPRRGGFAQRSAQSSGRQSERGD
jgi:hypothetical protein